MNQARSFFCLVFAAMLILAGCDSQTAINDENTVSESSDAAPFLAKKSVDVGIQADAISALALEVPEPTAGSYVLCKDADDPGTFSFNVVVTHDDGRATEDFDVDVDAGACEEIVTDATQGDNSGSDVTVSEYAKDGWSFDSGTIYGVVAGETDFNDPEVGPALVNFYHGKVAVFRNTLDEIPGGGQGCTPGYFKGNADNWYAGAWIGHGPADLVGDVFDTTGYEDLDDDGNDDTLRDALSYGGGPGAAGAARNLLRHGVAALLNASNPAVSYDMSEQDVIDWVNDALASGDRKTINDAKNVLAGYNEQGCPINQHWTVD